MGSLRCVHRIPTRCTTSAPADFQTTTEFFTEVTHRELQSLGILTDHPVVKRVAASTPTQTIQLDWSVIHQRWCEVLRYRSPAAIDGDAKIASPMLFREIC